LEKIDEITDVTKLKSTAHRNDSTEKLTIKASASMTIKASTTKVNSPKVKKFMGKVKSVSTGLIKVLISPNTMATITADTKPSTVIPGRIIEVK